MSAGHTAGPWTAEPSCNEDGDPYWSDDLLAPVWLVATPQSHDTATWLVENVREADARLIAAAPCMAEALAMAIAEMEAIRPNVGARQAARLGCTCDHLRRIMSRALGTPNDGENDAR